MRTQDAQFLHSLDKIDAIIVMFLNPRGHRKDVGIKDDVFWRKADAHKQVVGALANFDLALLRVSLSGFIKRHDDHSCAIRHAQTRVMQEGFFALFHRYRIHDRLARNTFQPGFNYAPF